VIKSEELIGTTEYLTKGEIQVLWGLKFILIFFSWGGGSLQGKGMQNYE